MWLYREEGQVLPLFAAAVGALLLMTGVVIDGGNLFQSRQSLQNAADAAAIAAALEVSNGACPSPSPGSGCTAAANYAGKYAGLNGVKNADGTTPTTQLDRCPDAVTDTTPPQTPPGCYRYPYVDSQGNEHDDQVEVWLTQKISNFFGGLLGTDTSTESARAIGALTSGNPPPYTFVSLNSTCEHHTLLVRLAGNLTVTSGIFTDSCSGLASPPTNDKSHDAFDVFDQGSISAPTIQVVGGWEVHNLSRVFTGGRQCTLPYNNLVEPGQYAGAANIKVNTDTPGYGDPPPLGCPEVKQPVVEDPFGDFPSAPTLGPGNLGVPVSIAKISRAANGNAANIAEVVTRTAHGLAANALVTISGVGFGFDGTYTAATVKSSTDFTYNNSTGSDGCGAAPCPAVPAVSQEQMTGGAATLTTNAPSTLNTGENDLTVTGLAGFFNVVNALVIGTTSTVSSGTFSYQSPLGPRTFSVTKKALAKTGTVTLTVGSIAGLAAGDKVNVTLSPVDPLIPNGSYVLTGVGAGCPGGGTTICYAIPPGTMKLNVTTKKIANTTTATLTVPNNNVAAGDQITVNTGDSRFDGTFNATAATGGAGGTVSYTIPAVTANITTKSASAGTATLTTSAAPRFEAGDTVSVALGRLAWDGSFTVRSVSGNTFTYTTPTFQNIAGSPGNPSWTKSDRSITVVTASLHALHAGDTIKVTGAPGGASCSTTATTTFPVTSVQTNGPFTFTYTVPAACNPGSSGNQKYNFQVWNAAPTSLAGTVTLITMPAINTSPSPCVNCITVPAVEAANGGPGSIGSAVLTDVPATTVSGAFTPAWMPTFGVFAQNLPGSPGIPFPVLISSGSPTLMPGTYYGGICIGAAAGSNCLDLNCKAAGGSTTSTQPYSPAVHLAENQPASDTDPNYNTLVVDDASQLQVGDVIAIDDEEETVTVISANTLTVTRETNATEDAAHSADTQVFKVITVPNGTPYNPAKKLSAGINATVTSIPVNSTNPNPIGVGDVIQIGSEAMTVTAIPDATHLTVIRGTYNTTPATHANGAAVLKIFDASAPPPPTVTLQKGIYIMAGGGFSVCGAASVRAPDGAMIYNTNDPSSPTSLYGTLGQVNINTSGSVHLGPMKDGIYAGMTIFQDRSQTLSTKGCDQKSHDPTEWDIALQSAAPLPQSGALGSITGTVYAPHEDADFGVSMSGSSNLAVITSCIYINGADSTFTHNTGVGNLFGVTATLGG